MLKVLRDKEDIIFARCSLRKRGLDCLPGKFATLLRRFSLLRTVAVGDPVKSWDLLLMAEFIQQEIPLSGKVLDIGAYASEMLPILERLGFENLIGIDLNPEVVRMPARATTTYRVGDFYDIFDPEGFDAITAISVIEHGFDAQALIGTISANLRENGYFLATCDYWPEKVDTLGVSPFGLSWTIFSTEELHSFFALAASAGLHPVGTLDFSASEAAINWGGRNYTFAWFVLQKKTGRLG